MADVAVVGAGIVGLTAAYELARQGLDVVLADAGRPGRATDAGAGIVNPLDLTGTQSPAERIRRSLFDPARYGALIEALAEDGQTEPGYAQAGQLVLGADSGLRERLEADPVGTYLGSIQTVDGIEAAHLVPYLTGDLGGILLPGVARVDGQLLRAALLGALRRRGVECRSGTAGLTLAGDRVTGITLGTERIGAGSVVVATGAWSPGGGPGRLFARIRPDRGQIVHLRYERPFPSPVPIVSRAGGSYMLAFPPNRVVAGATHDDAGFDCRVTAGGLRSVLTEALQLAPGLADSTVLETRVGFRPVSADGLPVLGPVPGLSDVVVATGLGAHGLTLGPVAGTIAARLALGQDAGTDLSAVQPGRLLEPESKGTR